MRWNSVETDLPSDARVVVGLRPFGKLGKKTYDRVFVQFMSNRWSYAGSDQRCRDLKWWTDLPPFPKEK